jgi:transposase
LIHTDNEIGVSPNNQFRTKRVIEWYLHIPIVKKVSLKPINEQKKENPNLTTLAVDLGLRHLAVVTVRQAPRSGIPQSGRGKRATELDIRRSFTSSREFGIKRLWFSKGFFNSEFRILNSEFEKPSCYFALLPPPVNCQSA